MNPRVNPRANPSQNPKVSPRVRDRRDRSLFAGGAAPAILSVDAEGNDPLVLRGAARALASGRVRYLEFEHQRYRAWSKLELADTIRELDDFGYECFWALDKGKLVTITRCWHPTWTHKHSWSNVVCARREDACAVETLRRFRAYDPS